MPPDSIRGIPPPCCYFGLVTSDHFFASFFVLYPSRPWGNWTYQRPFSFHISPSSRFFFSMCYLRVEMVESIKFFDNIIIVIVAALYVTNMAVGYGAVKRFDNGPKFTRKRFWRAVAIASQRPVVCLFRCVGTEDCANGDVF